MMKKRSPRSFPKKLLSLLLAASLLLSGNLILASGADGESGAGASSVSSELPSSPAPGTEPSLSPAPSGSPAPTLTPDPAESPAPSESPDVTPAPSGSPAPSASPAPSGSPAPSASPAPTPSASPAPSSTPLSPSPSETPNTSASPEPAPEASPAPNDAVDKLLKGTLLGLSLLKATLDDTMDQFITPPGKLVNVTKAEDVTDGSEISLEDSLRLEYSFTISSDQAAAIGNGTESGSEPYSLTLPNYFGWTDTKTSIPLKTTDTDETFANLNVAEDGTTSVTFVKDFATTFSGGIQQGWLKLGCKLNEDAVRGNNDDGKIVTGLIDGGDITVTVTEFLPELAKLQKENCTYKDDKFHWVIRYTGGTKNMDKTAEHILSDHFDSVNMKYLAGTFTVSPENAVTLDDSGASDGNLLFTLADPKTDVTVEYDTTLTDDAFAQEGQITAKNTVTLQDRKNGETADVADVVPAAATGTAESSAKDFILKSADSSKIAKPDGIITWTLDVYTRGRDLSNLVLTDTIPAGLTYTDSAILADGADAGDEVTVACTENGEDTANTLTYTFKAKPAKSHYTITYTTTVAEKFYTTEINADFTNKVTMSFTWNETPTSQSAQAHVGIGNALGGVQKECIGYNAATHELTWKVWINPQELKPFKDVVITDIFPDAPDSSAQTYVEGSFCNNINMLERDKNSSTSKKLVVKIDDLSGETGIFLFNTTVDNRDDYSTNQNGKIYSNSVTCVATTPAGENQTFEDDGTQEVTSTVLKKTFEGYDYNTQLSTWKLEINQNKMPLHDVSVEDSLPVGLTYKDGSAKRGDTAIDRSNVSTESGVLKIQLGDLTGSETITFQTKLDPNQNPEFLEKDSVTITNKATLKSSDDSAEHKPYTPTDDETSHDVKNQSIGKTQSVGDDQDLIHYTVQINPNKLNLPDDTNNTVIDTLPDGTRLNIAKDVRLYAAAVDPDTGALTKTTTEVSLAEDQLTLAKTADGKWQMKVILPENSKPYVLEYDLDIIDFDTYRFDNSIAFEGKLGGKNIGKSHVPVSIAGGGGGGLSTRVGAIEITKTDFHSGTPVKGAEFTIYDTADLNTAIDEPRTTDETGKVSFRGLYAGHTYRVKETGMPVGYKPADPDFQDCAVEKTMSELIADQADSNGFYPLSWTNTRVTADLSFTKTNPWGRMLPGAVFILEPKAGTLPLPEETKTATSDAEGKVLFADVPYGEYTLTETKAPDFHQEAEVMAVTVDKDGNLSVTGDDYSDGSVTDEFDKADLKITKINKKTGKPMKGVEFTLYDSQGVKRGVTGTDETGQDVIGTGKTDENGVLTFTGLMLGEEYRIRETRVSGFLPSRDQKITLTEEDKDQTIELTWENTPIPPTPLASIRIEKVDASTGKPMANVEFEVLDSDGYRWGYGTTDETGVLVLEGLPADTTYTLHETTPEGYLDAPDRELELSEEKEYAVRWENTPKPPVDPSPSPSPTPTPKPSPTPTPKPSSKPSPTPTPKPGSGGKKPSSGKKLPQTGRNQLAPYLTLGAGLLLAGAGGVLYRRKKNKHEK